ncbi:hypothetical protein PSPO01_10392 [Paraphaeosphaeria sporulosa]
MPAHGNFPKQARRPPAAYGSAEDTRSFRDMAIHHLSLACAGAQSTCSDPKVWRKWRHRKHARDHALPAQRRVRLGPVPLSENHQIGYLTGLGQDLDEKESTAWRVGAGERM